MTKEKVANDLQINDIVTILADVVFYVNGNKEKMIIRSGTDCLIAEFSYDSQEKPNAAILERYNSDKRFTAIATVEFQYFKFKFRTPTARRHGPES